MANILDNLLRQARQAQQNYQRNAGLTQNIPSGNPLGPLLGGGNGGGIVPTAEQAAYSEEMARRFGVPTPEQVTYDDVPPEGVYEQGIDVNGVRPPVGPPPEPQPVDPSKYLLDAPVSMNNSDWVEEAHAANQRNEESGKRRHKGAFGQTGTLRNIMGVVGDAFLVQGGRDPIYAPQRQRERIADAMAGHTVAPAAAAERVTQYDPATGYKMANDIANREQAGLKIEELIKKEQAARQLKGAEAIAKAAGGTNPETYAQMKEIIESIRVRSGLGEEYKLPDTYDENFMRSLQYSGMPPAAQVNAGLSAERNEISRGSLGVRQAAQQETARHNRQTEAAARARIAKMGGGRQARSQSPLEYFKELEKIPREQRSQDENNWMDKQTGQTSRRGGSSRSSGSDRSSRFKIIR